MKMSGLPKCMRPGSKTIVLLILLFLVLVSSCARWTIKDRVAPPPEAAEIEGVRRVGVDPPLEYEYRIGVNDTLQIRFINYPDLLEPQIVVPSNGIIQMPFVGGIQVLGYSEGELNSFLKEKYAQHLKFPELVARIMARQHDGVFLDGALLAGGTIAYNNRVTLLDSLKKGGMGESGAIHSVIVLRGLNTPRFAAFRVDAIKILKGEEHDIYLEPNDIVYVPKKFIADVNNFVAQYIDGVLGRHIAPAIIFPQAFPFKTENTGTVSTTIGVPIPQP